MELRHQPMVRERPDIRSALMEEKPMIMTQEMLEPYFRIHEELKDRKIYAESIKLSVEVERFDPDKLMQVVQELKRMGYAGNIDLNFLRTDPVHKKGKVAASLSNLIRDYQERKSTTFQEEFESRGVDYVYDCLFPIVGARKMLDGTEWIKSPVDEVMTVNE